MAEMTKPAQNNNDEIDLIHVLDRISRFLSSCKKELILTALAGILCGYVIYLTQPKSYISTLILQSQILTNPEEIEIIDSWNNLLSDQGYDLLSKNLNCPVFLLRNIKHLSASNIPNALPASGFTVEVNVKDTAILEDLQKAIVYGLENIEYVREKVDLKRNNTIKIIENINQEIAKLDSTKKQIENSKNGKFPGSPSFIVDISGVNVQMINLNEKLYQYQEALKFIDAIQVLQNFEKYVKPPSYRLFTLIISGFLGGLFAGIILALVKNVRMKIDVFRKSRQTLLPNKETV
jgi:hypothetical protein